MELTYKLSSYICTHQAVFEMKADILFCLPVACFCSWCGIPVVGLVVDHLLNSIHQYLYRSKWVPCT